MPPAAAQMLLHDKDDGDVSVPLLDMACAEIEHMRNARKEEEGVAEAALPHQQHVRHGHRPYRSFPPACLALLRRMDGNHRCIDCGCSDPQWAAVSYGALLCLQCSGHHRSLGVHVSLVRSIGMDEWSLEHVLAMLEGGNGQLSGFYTRHHLTSDTCPDADIDTGVADPGDGDDPQQPPQRRQRTTLTRHTVTRLRYKTKAAVFYRQQLGLHVSQVLEAGPYRGRDNARTAHHYPTQQLERRNSE